MSSIVLELQQGALNRDIPVSDLLRKALVVAGKLGLTELESWINKELNGYTGVCPDYRIIRGAVKVWDQFRGWQPVMFQDPEQGELLSRRACGQRIAEIESLAEKDNSDTSSLMIPYSKKLELQLMKAIRADSPPMLLVQFSSLKGILDAVRTIILNWALKLEQDGILGEGLSFTSQEKATASKVSYNINTFYGPVGQSQIQQDAHHAIQISICFDPDKVREFVRSVRDSIDELQLGLDSEAELKAELQTLESQVASPKPKSLILRESLSSLRRILEGTATTVGAQLLIQLGTLLPLSPQ